MKLLGRLMTVGAVTAMAAGIGAGAAALAGNAGPGCDPTAYELTNQTSAADTGLTRDVYEVLADCQRVGLGATPDNDEAQPEVSPDGERVAYVSSPQDSDRTSILLTAAGGRSVIAFASETPVGDPTWSPDGGALAFWKDNGKGVPAIWVLDLASGQSRQVSTGTMPEVTPAWSPDGRTLAYARAAATGSRLVVLDLGNGEERVLASGEGAFKHPSWSPDGTRLVATVAQPANHPGQPAESVAVVGADTGTVAASTSLNSRVLDVAWSGDERIQLVLDGGALNTVVEQTFDETLVPLASKTIDSGIPALSSEVAR